MSHTRRLVLVAVIALITPGRLSAQAAQRFSIQGSGLVIKLFGDAFPGAKIGYGGEAQLRYTPSALSLGVGFQYTSHKVEGVDTRATLIGGFFEPRYVISTSSSSLFPYLSGRFYIVKLKSDNDAAQIRTKATGLAANGGGGVLVRAASRVNVDIGATFGYSKFKDFKVEFLATGVEGEGGNDTNGTNLVGRLGLTIGF